MSFPGFAIRATAKPPRSLCSFRHAREPGLRHFRRVLIRVLITRAHATRVARYGGLSRARAVFLSRVPRPGVFPALARCKSTRVFLLSAYLSSYVPRGHVLFAACRKTRRHFLFSGKSLVPSLPLPPHHSFLFPANLAPATRRQRSERERESPARRENVLHVKCELSYLCVRLSV